MKRNLIALLAAATAVSSASADSLYYIGSEAQESLPLKWVVGADLTYDSNVSPTALLASSDSAYSINPYVGLSFVNMSPQSTLDVYARIGGIYYFDKPAGIGTKDFYWQARMGVNWTRRFNEKLRFSTRNLFAYELEPDYSYGFATSRQSDPYTYWQTDNSIGYRWTERWATYTGFQITDLNYDSRFNGDNRTTWTGYNQFRYQLNPQSVLTFDYRYAKTSASGRAGDSTSQYLLLGMEHRFSPNTILVTRVGAQFKTSDAILGSDTTSPYVEFALRSQVNTQFSYRAYLRYGVEVYDTTRQVIGIGGVGFYDYDDRKTLRLGLSGEYSLSPMLSLFGGVDYIPAKFDDGRLVGISGGAPLLISGGLDENVVNAYIGLSMKFTQRFSGTLSYNYTDSNSDFIGYSYDRSRVSLGVRAEF